MNADRLTKPLGEAMFTQRSVRKFRPDPIAPEDIRLLLEAAVKAPNGGNHQTGRFLAVTDREKIREFGALTARRGGPSGWTTTAGPDRRTSRRGRRTTPPPWIWPRR